MSSSDPTPVARSMEFDFDFALAKLFDSDVNVRKTFGSRGGDFRVLSQGEKAAKGEKAGNRLDCHY